MSKGQKTAYVQQVSNGFIVKFDTEGDYGESTYTFVYPTMEEVTGALEGWFADEADVLIEQILDERAEAWKCLAER